MDEKDLEKAFTQLKNELPVNEILKQSLRSEFLKPKGRGWKKGFAVAAAIASAAAALVVAAYLGTPDKFVQKANAAALKIANHISFVDIGGGNNLGVSEYKGKVYVPIAGKGLFVYDHKGFHKLLGNEVSYVRVSGDGQQLAISAQGTISTYDLKTGQTKEMVKGDTQSIFFEEPSWSGDNNHLIYTKKTYQTGESHGFTVKDEVYTIDLKTKETKKLADGSHGQLTRDDNGVIVEKEQKIIYKNLTSGAEKVVDEGRFPALSPDGSYLAYVKTQQTKREVGAKALQARISESMENVWITDGVDFKTKKKVTSNFPHRFMDEQEWLKTLQPSPIPQELSYSGRYSYYEPVWSSDANSLYVLKNNNANGDKGDLRLVRIQLSTKKLTGADTVKRYVQALIARDDDYAKSLRKSAPQYLTISNPHQVGYKIIGSGQEGGREYVDADVNWEYTANPYYQVVRSRFYLSPDENGYIIDSIKDLQTIEVTNPGNGEAIYLTAGKDKQELFRAKDIPVPLVPKDEHRFASLAYNDQAKVLVFTLQVLKTDQVKSQVWLISYDLKTKEFKLIDKIAKVKVMENIGVANLTIDSQGRYAALDLFSEDFNQYVPLGRMYDLNDKTMVELPELLKDTKVEAVHTRYWDEGKLVFSITSEGQTMGYIYNPREKQIHSF